MKTAASLRAAGIVSIALFAFGGAMLVALYLNGAVIDPDKGREAMIAAIWNHVGWGAASAPALLAYAGWRIFAGAAPRVRLADGFALVLPVALALAVVFLVVSGPLTVWTYGRALKVFDWFAIASPTGNAPALHSFVEQAHGLVARAVPWLIGAEAALFAASFIRKRPA